jgi:hypothetical protein
MQLGHLSTRSGLTHPEVSSKVCHDSFCQLGNSVSLLWIIYYGAFYLHVVSSFSYIPVICLKLVLFLIPLQFVHLFCNQSKCIQTFAHRKSLYATLDIPPMQVLVFHLKWNSVVDFHKGCVNVKHIFQI